MTQQQFTVAEFATRIKEKYPSYADMDDQELVDKIVAKYPQYGEQIKKKDDTEFVSEDGSLEPPVVDGFEDKSERARNIRTIARINEEGDRSTVKMADMEVDGKFVAIPTLFPINPDNYGSDPKDWVEFGEGDAMGAYDMALERGEVFEFDTPEEARAFAEGAWKADTPVEQPLTEQDQFFEMALEAITPELIDRGDEDKVAFELNELLGQYGFEVETSSILGDALTVKGRNGQSIDVDLDPWRSSTEVKEAEKLRQFLIDNRRESENILKQDDDYQVAKLKFATEKQIDENVARLSQEQDDYLKFSQRVNDFALEIEEKYAGLDKYTEEYLRNNPEEYDEYKAQYDAYADDMGELQSLDSQLQARYQRLQYSEQEINRAAGEYIQTKGGLFLSDIPGLAKRAFAQGSARILRGTLDLGLDAGNIGRGIDYKIGTLDRADEAEDFVLAANELGVTDIPEDAVENFDSWWNSLSEDLQNNITSKHLDNYTKAIKYGGEYASKLRKDGKVRSEFLAEKGLSDRVFDGVMWAFGESEGDLTYDLTKEGWWGGATLGTVESIPAFIGFGKSVVGKALGEGTRLFRLYIQNSDHIDEEFRNDPDLRDVSEVDKLKLKVPLSLTVAALERVGFRNVVQTRNVAGKLLLGAMRKPTSRAAGRTLHEVIARDVNNFAARGALTLASGAVAEFETGFAQEGADIAMKSLWNAASDNPDLNTPSGVQDILMAMLNGGAQEAVGSFVLGTPTAVGSAFNKSDFSVLSNAELAVFEWMSSPGNRGATKPMIAAHLKNLVNQGKLTGAEAKAALDGYERTAHAMDGVRGVEGLTPEQKKEYLALEIRRRELNQQLEGRAVPFRKAIEAEIGDIKIRQKEIADAVQEQSTEKVSTRDEAEAGPEVGGKVQDDEKATEKKGIVERMRDRLQQRRVRKSKEEYDKALALVDELKERGATEEEINDAEYKAGRARKEYLTSTLTKEQAAERDALEKESERLWGEYEKAKGTEQEDAASDAWNKSRQKVNAFIDNAEAALTQEAVPVEEVAPVEEAAPVEETAPVEEATPEEQAEAEALAAEFEAEGTPERTETTEAGVEVQKREGTELTKKQQRVVDQANRVITALKSVIPDIKVVAHQTQLQYEAATGKEGRGVYIGNTIHINLAKANSRTAFHEAFHAIFLQQVRDGDPDAQRRAKVLLNTIRKAVPAKSVLANRISKFLIKYQEQDISEEALAEIFGYVADGYGGLGVQAKSKIKAAVKKLIESVIRRKLGDSWSDGDQAVLDALELLAGKVERGEAITEEELEGIRVSEEAAAKVEAETEIDSAIGRVQKMRNEVVSKSRTLLGDLALLVENTGKGRPGLAKLSKAIGDGNLRGIEKKIRDVRKSKKMSEQDKAERVAKLENDAAAEVERIEAAREQAAKDAAELVEKLKPVQEQKKKDERLAEIRKEQKDITKKLDKDKKEAKKVFEGDDLKEFIADLVEEADAKRAALRDEIAELRGKKKKAEPTVEAETAPVEEAVEEEPTVGTIRTKVGAEKYSALETAVRDLLEYTDEVGEQPTRGQKNALTRRRTKVNKLVAELKLTPAEQAVVQTFVQERVTNKREAEARMKEERAELKAAAERGKKAAEEAGLTRKKLDGDTYLLDHPDGNFILRRNRSGVYEAYEADNVSDISTDTSWNQSFKTIKDAVEWADKQGPNRGKKIKEQQDFLKAQQRARKKARAADAKAMLTKFRAELEESERKLAEQEETGAESEVTDRLRDLIELQKETVARLEAEVAEVVEEKPAPKKKAKQEYDPTVDKTTGRKLTDRELEQEEIVNRAFDRYNKLGNSLSENSRRRLTDSVLNIVTMLNSYITVAEIAGDKALVQELREIRASAGLAADQILDMTEGMSNEEIEALESQIGRPPYSEFNEALKTKGPINAFNSTFVKAFSKGGIALTMSRSTAEASPLLKEVVESNEEIVEINEKLDNLVTGSKEANALRARRNELTKFTTGEVASKPVNKKAPAKGPVAPSTEIEKIDQRVEQLNEELKATGGAQSPRFNEIVDELAELGEQRRELDGTNERAAELRKKDREEALKKKAAAEGISVEELTKEQKRVELQRKDALSREAKRELDGLKGKTDKESKAKRAELREFMSNLGTMSVDEARAKRTEGKLKGREQRMTDFTEERFLELGRQGIFGHGSRMDISMFDEDFISTVLSGYGFYFTNFKPEAQAYGDRVTFVDTSGMTLRDATQEFTEEEAEAISARLMQQAVIVKGSEERAGDMFYLEDVADAVEGGGMRLADFHADGTYPLMPDDGSEGMSYYAAVLQGLEDAGGPKLDGVFSTRPNSGETMAVLWNFDKINESIIQPSGREQRVADVVERYEFRPNGSLKNASLADELRRNLKRYGFGVKQFGTRMDDFHIVNLATGRKVDPKKLIVKDRADEKVEMEQRAQVRERDAKERMEREDAEDLRTDSLKKYQAEYLDFPEDMIPPSKLSAREQREDLSDSTVGFSVESVVRFAKERGYSDKAILLVRPDAQAAIDEYDAKAKRVSEEIQGIIQRTKERARRDPSIQAIDNKGARAKAVNDRVEADVIAYLRGTKLYEDASDVGRNAMELAVKKQMGRRIKAAPSVNAILDAPKGKSFTVNEKEALRQKIRDMARSSRTTAAAIAAARKALAQDIAKLRKGGALTPAQATALMSRMARTNPLNEASVNKFVEYADNVFKDADYAAKMNRLNRMRNRARTNAEKKTGINVDIIDAIRTITGINAELIPEDVLEQYSEVIEQLAERKAVLDLENRAPLREKLGAVLDAIDQELNAKDELLAEFENFGDKAYTKEGKVIIAKTIKAMVEAGVITGDEAELLRKYSQELFPEPEGKTEEERENARNEEKTRLLTAVEAMPPLEHKFPTREENVLLRQFNELIKTTGIEALDNAELKNLLRVASNIENGFLPHMAEVLVEKIDADNKRAEVMQSIYNDKSGLARLIDRTGLSSLRRRGRKNPVRYVDQVWGDFKSTRMFDAVFKDLAVAAASYRSELQIIEARMDAVENDLIKALKRNPNKITRAKFLLGAYMMQQEAEANPGAQGIYSAVELLDATIEASKELGSTRYNDMSIDVLRSIRDQIEGRTAEEIEAIIRKGEGGKAMMAVAEEIRKINDELTPKAQYTASVIRGVPFMPYSQYFHRVVLKGEKEFGDDENMSLSDVMNNNMMPSTRAKNLEERTSTSPPPVNFDPFASINRGAKFVLTDYHMTKPVRTNKRMLNKLKKEEYNTGRQRQMAEFLIEASETLVKDMLVQAVNQDSLGQKVLNYIKKTGYQVTLGQVERAVAELGSNASYAAFVDHGAFLLGQKYRNIYNNDGADILKNVGSMQTTRLFPGGQGTRFESTGLDQMRVATSPGRAEMRNEAANKASQIWSQTGGRASRITSTIADTLITKPDQMISRPLWFGSFAREFEARTGKKPDMNKIAKNDAEYMDRYRDAIEAAKDKADDTSIKAGATDNLFLGMLNGTVRPGDGAINVWRFVNSYMTRFLIFEYVTARTAVQAMMGNGMIRKRDGVRLLAGVTARMFTYQLIASLLRDTIASILYGDDDEEKDLTERAFDSVISGGAALVLGNTMGQVGRGLVAIPAEMLNREYVEHSGEEYGFGKRKVMPLIDINQEKQWDGRVIDGAARTFGPASATVRALLLGLELGAEEVGMKKPRVDRARAEQEQLRLLFKGLGAAGLLPFANDINYHYQRYIYKDLDKEDTSARGRSPRGRSPRNR